MSATTDLKQIAKDLRALVLTVGEAADDVEDGEDIGDALQAIADATGAIDDKVQEIADDNEIELDWGDE